MTTKRKENVGHYIITIWQAAGSHGLSLQCACEYNWEVSKQISPYGGRCNVFPIVTLNSFTCHTDSLFSYWHMVIECVLPIENINDYVEQSNLWI